MSKWHHGREMWDEALRVQDGDLLAAAVDALASAEEGDAALMSRRCTFLGYCRSDAFKPREAVAYLQKAVALDSNNILAWRELLLVVERDMGDLKGARAVCAAGFWVDEMQRPGFMLPGLEAKPWWDDIQWVAQLEGICDSVVLPELARLDAKRWAVVGDGARTSGHDDGSVVQGGEWRELVLMGSGATNVAPRTTAFLRSVPAVAELCDAGGGEVIFSKLAPRTRLKPHCAPTNLRLTAHLGLRIPSNNCFLRVGNAPPRPWECGKVLLFDDSFEHEVRNDTDETRVVLLIRFFHPGIALSKRKEALQAAIDAKADAEKARWLCPP